MLTFTVAFHIAQRYNALIRRANYTNMDAHILGILTTRAERAQAFDRFCSMVWNRYGISASSIALYVSLTDVNCNARSVMNISIPSQKTNQFFRK